MTSKKHVTSHAQFYQVCEWAKGADLSKSESIDGVAAAATKSLGFPVPTYTIKSALEILGKPFVSSKTYLRRNLNQIVAAELVVLLRELGKEPSAELLSVVHRKGA